MMFHSHMRHAVKQVRGTPALDAAYSVQAGVRPLFRDKTGVDAAARVVYLPLRIFKEHRHMAPPAHP